MQERDTKAGQVEIHEPEPHSTHPEGPDKSPQRRRPHQTRGKLEERPSVESSPNVSESASLPHPPPLHVQCKEYSPTDGRPTKNPTRTPNEVRFPRHKQYALKHTNRRSDKILNDLCIKENVEEKTRNEIAKLTQTIINQIYFRFQDNIYQQNEGLAMGSPTSSILSEVYIQHMEGTTIPMILSKHSIKGYYRYVDDMLIVHTDSTTNIHTVLDEFNSITPKLQFTLEEEQDDKINFLDFTIIKTHKGLSFDIYRKPTTTDLTIPKDSCHPFEQKTAAIRYHRDRLLSYRLSPGCREKEKETINPLTPNDAYRRRTAPLTSKVAFYIFIQQI